MTSSRTNIAFAALAAVCAVFDAACSPAPRPPAFAADTVLTNGTVLTVDAHDAVAQALAIKNGRIVFVGTSADAEAYVGPSTQRIDLAGMTATPGLIDAHAHFANGGGELNRVIDVSYPAVKSAADIAQKVRERAATTPPGEWILGRGWDEGKLDGHRYVYGEDLDEVSPEHPVYLTHTTGHYGVANGKAMQMAGITKATPDPPGGTIDRHPDGTPTGVLKEGALNLVRRLIPRPTPQQIDEGIKRISAEFNKEGMTGAKDPGIFIDTWNGYQRVRAAGALTTRVFVLWRMGQTLDDGRALVDRIAPFTKPYVSTGDDLLVSGGVKLMIDGSGGARTAWMYDDWNKAYTDLDKGNKGYPLYDPRILREQIRVAHDAGVHIGVHAIGDQAIDWVVDSYTQALEATPTKGMRHSIIHANVPSDHAIETIATLQHQYDAGYPEPSASFMWWIGDNYAANFGKDRSLRMNPFKTYLAKGIQWAGASDFGVTPFAARYGLWASLARETLLGVHGKTPFGMDQAVDAKSALRSFTIWAAYQLFLEKKTGSLEVGKYADVAVWNVNPYTATPDAIKDMTCQLTLLNGDVVYRLERAPAATH